jgi:hypothetical protein
MVEMPEFFDFGSSEKLLEYIKERSDDIEKVVILPPGVALHYMGQQMGPPQQGFSMMLHFVGGKREQICQADAEILLNDGILSRMKLKIEFMRR